MKRKKGFTLIELLAVIVILAIIALIATPIILNMINDAKKSAAKDSAYGYIEAVEYNNSMSNLGLNNGYTKIDDGEYSDVTGLDVKVKGTPPTSGTMEIENGRVIIADLCINNYSVHYNGTLATVTGSCGSNGSSSSGSSGDLDNKSNTNIVAIYKYNETTGASDYCVSGEESTCVKEELSKTKTYDVGTIIKYNVNSSETKYFNVIKDNGDTLTLQQRENTTENVEWVSATDYDNNTYSCSYAPSCWVKGPITVLNLLEQKTSGWTNVNTFNYKLSNNTGCYEGDCDMSKYSEYSDFPYSNVAYTITRENVKARMLTLDELKNVCNNSITISNCPKFIINYLKYSTSSGGTNNISEDLNSQPVNGYWLSSVDVTQKNQAFAILTFDGSTGYESATNFKYCGARAIVEINK